MRKIFQHNYIVIVLALAALTLALVSISAPKIEDYNSKVEEEQRKLRTEADGYKGLSFATHGIPDAANPTFYAGVAIPLSLFFSLLLTKRIIFSFLFAFLFIFQFRILFLLFLEAIEFPMSYFVNTPIYAPLFVGGVLALSYWTTTVIMRFCKSIGSGLKTSL